MNTAFSGLGETPTGELDHHAYISLVPLPRKSWDDFVTEELEEYVPDVRFDAGFLAFDGPGVERDVDGGVGCCFVRIEVLDEGRVGVEVRAGRVPRYIYSPPHEKMKKIVSHHSATRIRRSHTKRLALALAKYKVTSRWKKNEDMRSLTIPQ